MVVGSTGGMVVELGWNGQGNWSIPHFHHGGMVVEWTPFLRGMVVEWRWNGVHSTAIPPPFPQVEMTLFHAVGTTVVLKNGICDV